MINSSPPLNDLHSIVVKWMEMLEQAPVPTEEKKKEIYYIAYALYRDKCYQEAILFFRFLTMVEPAQIRYWKGLAASLQMAREYSQAICCYNCAQTLNGPQADPYLDIYRADCYFALKQVKKGLEALKAAELVAKRHKRQQILKHIGFMRTRWSNQKG